MAIIYFELNKAIIREAKQAKNPITAAIVEILITNAFLSLFILAIPPMYQSITT
ncbi:MAG: hypothetical protein IKL21_02195 [Clostridia bacterium]|nr:hypothetical protein [Clostridia bacterium]